MILAISILISRTLVVLKTSVASMTATDMITSLASMISTASLASKNQNMLELGDFLAIWNLSSLNDLNSLSGLVVDERCTWPFPDVAIYNCQ